LFAANRTKIPLLGRMNMDFTVAGKPYSAKLAVTNQVDELILGIDWLQEMAAMWDFGAGKIYLGGKWIWLQQRVTEDRVRRVYAAESIEIPPMSEANIPVTVTWPTLHPTRSDWLVEPKVVNEGLVVARTLVSGEAPSSVVRVINVSDQTYNIDYDTELGLASQVSVTLESDELADAKSRVTSSPRWMSITTQLDTSHVDCVISQLKNNLSTGQRATVAEFVRKNADVFSASEFDLGHTDLLEHSIELDSTKPVRQALRRHPVAYLPLIDEYIEQMAEHGIVQPMPGSEWVANIVLVRKKDGNLRYCVDYRGLNAVTQKRNYPLPRIDTCLESLGNNCLFTSLDMRSGYWQVPVKPEDRPKTCFVTRKGIFGFNVLPFGLTNAPSPSNG